MDVPVDTVATWIVSPSGPLKTTLGSSLGGAEAVLLLASEIKRRPCFAARRTKAPRIFFRPLPKRLSNAGI